MDPIYKLIFLILTFCSPYGISVLTFNDMQIDFGWPCIVGGARVVSRVPGVHRCDCQERRDDGVTTICTGWRGLWWRDRPLDGGVGVPPIGDDVTVRTEVTVDAAILNNCFWSCWNLVNIICKVLAKNFDTSSLKLIYFLSLLYAPALAQQKEAPKTYNQNK